MKRAARIAGRVALGLLVGAVLDAIIGLGLDLALSLAGVNTMEVATSQAINVVAALIGWPLGLWLVFRWAIRRQKSKPTATVPSEQWGRRP